MFTETQPPTSMFSFNKSDDEVLNTAPAIKTKIAELQRQLALLEVMSIILKMQWNKF